MIDNNLSDVIIMSDHAVEISDAWFDWSFDQ